MSGLGARGRTHGANRAEYAAAVKRLDAQLATCKSNRELLDGRLGDYEDLRGLLTDLPEKLTHPVVVPYGPLAFFEGHLEHTNEVLVQLSSEWFAMRTAKNAMGTIDRRERRLRSERADVDKETDDLEKRRKVAASEAGIDLPPTAGQGPTAAPPGAPAGSTVEFDDDGFVDIREPFDGEGDGEDDAELPAAQRQAEGGGSRIASSADAVSDRLKELERLEELEELEEQEGEKPGELDEMRELDNLMEHYEAGGPGGPRGVVDLQSGPAAAAAAAAGRPIQSPADLARMMSVAAADEARPPPSAEKKALDAAQERAFHSTVMERGCAPPSSARSGVDRDSLRSSGRRRVRT